MTDKVFELRPVKELLAIVKNDLKTFDDEGLIDMGKVIKTIMYCNEKLGLYIRDIKEVAIKVDNFMAELPVDFDKLYFAAALDCTNSGIATLRSALDNNVDQDVIYKASLDRESLGCADHYMVKIERKGIQIPYYQSQWVPLGINRNSSGQCHSECPNLRKPGRYEVQVVHRDIRTPFRTGTLYIIYVGLMVDEEGNTLYLFHSLITPYYACALKEKILSDADFK